MGLVQYDPDWEDKERNKQKLDWLLENNYKESEVLIFPEMTLTGFTMNSSEFARDIGWRKFSYFFKRWRRKYKSDIIAGIIESEKNKYFNTLNSY